LRQLTEYQLIVDSTEQPIVRPIDYELQKDYYSGKKKMHTLKNQFIVLPQGQDIVVMLTVGKTSDINLFREHQNKFRITKVLGDKAYKGEAPELSKNGEITETQNKKIKIVFIPHRCRTCNRPSQNISSS